MVAAKQVATLVRGADGSLYVVSDDSCKVLKEEMEQSPEANPSAEMAEYAGADRDYAAARAYVDPGDSRSARAYVDPGDYTTT